MLNSQGLLHEQTVRFVLDDRIDSPKATSVLRLYQTLVAASANKLLPRAYLLVESALGHSEYRRVIDRLASTGNVAEQMERALPAANEWAAQMRAALRDDLRELGEDAHVAAYRIGDEERELLVVGDCVIEFDYFETKCIVATRPDLR